MNEGHACPCGALLPDLRVMADGGPPMICRCGRVYGARIGLDMDRHLKRIDELERRVAALEGSHEHVH